MIFIIEIYNWKIINNIINDKKIYMVVLKIKYIYVYFIC